MHVFALMLKAKNMPNEIFGKPNTNACSHICPKMCVCVGMHTLRIAWTNMCLVACVYVCTYVAQIISQAVQNYIN